MELLLKSHLEYIFHKIFNRAVFIDIMARTKYTYRLKGKTQWVEKGKPVHSEDNPEDTCQEQLPDAHHVDLSGKPDHISIDSDSDKDGSSSEEEDSSEDDGFNDEDDDEEDYNEDDGDDDDEDQDQDEDYLEEEVAELVHIKGTYSGKPSSFNDSVTKIRTRISESKMGKPKLSDITVLLDKSNQLSQSKLRTGEPIPTEEVQVRRSTVPQMGKPNSIEEVEVEDQVWKSSGQPSSPNKKNIINEHLLSGKPKLTEEVENEKKRKREVRVNPTLYKNIMFQQIRQVRIKPNSLKK